MKSEGRFFIPEHSFGKDRFQRAISLRIGRSNTNSNVKIGLPLYFRSGPAGETITTPQG